MKPFLIVLLAFLLASCGEADPVKPEQEEPSTAADTVTANSQAEKKTANSVHVFVALCDNANQGIVPVPSALGNGEDPRNNLYWGALYGTKTFLEKRDHWTLVSETNDLNSRVMERIVFRHSTGNAFLVADAYRGARIKETITEFLSAAGGQDQTTITVEDDVIGVHGSADLVVYIGHNGLMDFTVEKPKPASTTHKREAIVLACKSKSYFQDPLESLGCDPLLLTTGFMAPEAYVLDAAVSAWVAQESNATVKEQAAAAYNEYQKCGMRGARGLFATSQY